MIGVIKISYESLVKSYRFPLVPLSDASMSTAFQAQKIMSNNFGSLGFLFLRTSAAKAFKSLNALGDVLPS